LLAVSESPATLEVEREPAPLRSAGEARAVERPHVTIRPSRGWVSLDLGELWRFRELLYFLVWRDVKVRYKQTAVGALWAILQPLLLAILFTLIFSRIGRLKPPGGVPYAAFAYAGLLPWLLFVTALTESSRSLVSNKELVTKVYFPRLAVPIATIIAALVDFFIASTVMVGIMAYYQLVPGIAILTLPLFLGLAVLTALAVGIWLAALNVQYRDVEYTIPFLTLLWMFATPVAYPVSVFPESVRPLLGLNPVAGVVEGFRWALFNKTPAPGALIFVSAGVMLVLLVTGLAYFRRMERNFADVI
jgi:lipopolysaccharide transport system permease protein